MGFVESKEGGKWGLGKVVKERRDKASMTPIEVHNTLIVSRPVDRAFNSQKKTYEQLVKDILTQVVDDIEDERVSQGKKRIVSYHMLRL